MKQRERDRRQIHISVKEKIMMQRYRLMLCTALVAGTTLIVGLATAADKAAETIPITSGLQTVQGDVLKIEGDSYVVKDMTGKEIRLHVDKTTKLEGSFKAGDKIEAQVTEKGHALSITKPLVADAQIPGPQTVKGDVLKMDGEFYVVKDMAGKEIRLHVDKTTELEGSFKAGDQIEARATEKDHALSIKHAQPPKM
jgi:exosome complex RNA-binding protein Csl4